ncbi:hypothetical protein ACFW9F_01835 [Streptomyces sp. NPDC059506]
MLSARTNRFCRCTARTTLYKYVPELSAGGRSALGTTSLGAAVEAADSR